MTVYTIGHSTRTLEELVGILRGLGVDTLVDIRRFPRSRTNPQFDAEALAPALAAAGIDYVAMPALGGRRGRKDAGGSEAIERQSGWEVEAFRAYAAYATTPAFRVAFAALVDLARRSRGGGGCGCTIMCSEALWWRCHRRIVADYLLSAGARVLHIMGRGDVKEGSLTPFAHAAGDGTLLYTQAQT